MHTPTDSKKLRVLAIASVTRASSLPSTIPQTRWADCKSFCYLRSPLIVRVLGSTFNYPYGY
ncbi:MAG: hypothetical protein V7K34_04615 [Nostoc sp.]